MRSRFRQEGRKLRPGMKPGEQQKTFVEQGFIPPQFDQYYRAQLIPEAVSEDGYEEMIGAFKMSLPHVFRIRYGMSFERLKEDLRRFAEDLRESGLEVREVEELDNRFGPVFKLNKDLPTLRHNPEMRPLHEWLTNNSELGTVVRQELVSMIPPFFLDVQAGHSVLDCCASPGSKTSQIIGLLSPTDGLLVTNDVNPNRCGTLIHTLSRYEMTKCIVISHPAQYLPDIGSFDRVLCDVPCSGDGTLRKNPDVALKWTVENGQELHLVQRAILIRGLQLLKVGGICVYSTCSLNPVEDEAVINSTLLEFGGSVEIVNCDGVLPGLVRTKGLTKWSVLSPDFQVMEKNDKNQTLFCQPQVENLTNCMRFLPHQNDTGGFFVTVLRKKAQVEVAMPNLGHKPLCRWRQPPFIPLVSISREIATAIREDYGPPDDFNENMLLVHDESSVNNIYMVNQRVLDLMNSMPFEELRPVACGTRIFTWKTLTTEEYVHAIPCIEGIEIVSKLATKRRVLITVQDTIKLMQAGNDGLHLKDLSLPESIMSEKPGGLIFCVEGTDFCYGGIRIKHKFVMYVKKHCVRYELSKLTCFEHS